jgi:hypothetical protein
MIRPRHRRGAHPASDTIDFQVIGELRDNPHHLLLLGDDGQCYCFDLRLDRIEPLDPDASWSVDMMHRAALHLELPIELLAS